MEEVSRRNQRLTFSISAWNILKPCGCLKSQALATMARCLPNFFRSYLHTKERLLRAIMLAEPRQAWERPGYQQVGRTHRDPINFSGILRPWPFKGQWGEIPV